MAINKNHEFEELNGIKCGIVEKNVSPARLSFLKELLEYNGFEVIAIPSPPPKAAPAPVAKEGETPAIILEPVQAPETYTVGVSDYTFNPTNALYGRLLRTRDRKVVTVAYWNQLTQVSDDEKPYFE